MLLHSEWPWLQKDMGPESFQIQIWGPKRWPAPTKSGVHSNFCLIKLLPKCTVEAPEALWTPFTHLVLGWHPQEPSPLEDHLHAKFHPNLYSSLDFYREQRDNQTHQHCPYIVDGPFPASFCLFSSFQTNIKFLQQINVKKCPSSIWCWDLEPQPLEHKPPPITTRPGLLPN